jgi:hypothetical protein
LGEIKPGPPPLVTGFKGIFGQEPGFEPRFFSVILPTIQRLALKYDDPEDCQHTRTRARARTQTAEHLADVNVAGFLRSSRSSSG